MGFFSSALMRFVFLWEFSTFLTITIPPPVSLTYLFCTADKNELVFLGGFVRWCLPHEMLPLQCWTLLAATPNSSVWTFSAKAARWFCCTRIPFSRIHCCTRTILPAELTGIPLCQCRNRNESRQNCSLSLSPRLSGRAGASFSIFLKLEIIFLKKKSTQKNLTTPFPVLVLKDTEFLSGAGEINDSFKPKWPVSDKLIWFFSPETSLLPFHMPRLENGQWVQKVLPARKPNHKQTLLGVSTRQETSPVKAVYKPDLHRGCPHSPWGCPLYRQPAAPQWLFPFQRHCGPSLDPCSGVGSSFPLGWAHSPLLVLELHHLPNRSPKVWEPSQDAQITQIFTPSWVRKLGGEQSSIFIWEPKEGTRLAPMRKQQRIHTAL